MTVFTASVAVVVFVLLVIPGMVHEFARERGGGSYPETAFREASRILVAGAFFTTVSLCLLALLGSARQGLLPDAGAWLARPAGPDGYPARHLPLIARTVLLHVVLACVLAWAAGRLGHRPSRSRYHPVHPWRLVFDKDLPEDRVPYVSVRLQDGTRVSGYVRHWPAASADPADAVLVLWKPRLTVKPKGGAVIPLDDWDRVVVRLDQSAYLQVA